MKFVIMSDTHYVSRRMLDDPSDSRMLNNIEVTEQALRQAAAEDCDTIIISGDLTDEGDIYSNGEFVRLLRALKAQGKKVYVIFATHDFHHNRAFVAKKGSVASKRVSKPWEMPYFVKERLAEDGYNGELISQLVDSVVPEDLWEMYREFGPSDAFSVYEPGYSYCVDLDEKTRCLMLNDIFRNEEALQDISASFTPGCFKWIKEMVDIAHKDGKYIFAVSHHPLMPAVPAHRLMTGLRNLRSPYTGHLLADIGIDLVFTGHTHLTDIGFMHSEAGNTLCDIASPSVRFYPPAYRVIDLDGEKHTVTYKTIEVEKPKTAQMKESNLSDYYRNEMYEEYYDKYCAKDNFLGNLLKKLQIKNIYFLFRFRAKLSKDEYKSIKETKVFDFLMNIVFALMSGSAHWNPETPEYKLAIAIAAFGDSIIDALPVMNLRNKYLKGYTCFQLIEPLMFTNGYSNTDGTLDFTKEPEKEFETKPAKSLAGTIITVILLLLTIILSPLLCPAAIILFVVNIYRKQAMLRRGHIEPLMKY